jgi:ABC-2 type transport system ATP-binding protein
MIEAHNLSKTFDKFQAVNNISLRVDEGKLFAFLGPNGAGKTTTVRMLTSLLRPTSGWARVAGYDVAKDAPMVRASVGVLTEQHGLYERMKASEYLNFFGQVYKVPADQRRQRSHDLMTRFGLGDAMNRRVGDFSKGMKQKLALVRALLHNPPILLLDEPTSAMDPQSAKQVRNAVEELKRDKRTIILTTHNLNEAQQLADQIGVIRHGRLIADGTFAELSERFTGQPLVEVRFAEAGKPFAESLNGVVEVAESGPDWLRYRTPNPQTSNPEVLRKLVGAGLDVVSVSQVANSLESVYLQIVAEDESTATNDEQPSKGKKGNTRGNNN